MVDMTELLYCELSSYFNVFVTKMLFNVL